MTSCPILPSTYQTSPLNTNNQTKSSNNKANKEITALATGIINELNALETEVSQTAKKVIQDISKTHSNGYKKFNELNSELSALSSKLEVVIDQCDDLSESFKTKNQEKAIKITASCEKLKKALNLSWDIIVKKYLPHQTPLNINGPKSLSFKSDNENYSSSFSSAESSDSVIF